MAVDPANIMNRLIIFLFIKNLYNGDKSISIKVINTPADALGLAHHSLLKLRV